MPVNLPQSRMIWGRKFNITQENSSGVTKVSLISPLGIHTKEPRPRAPAGWRWSSSRAVRAVLAPGSPAGLRSSHRFEMGKTKTSSIHAEHKL